MGDIARIVSMENLLVAGFGALAAIYPNVGKLAMAASHDGGLGGCDDDFEFAFGLGLILDGLDRHRTGV